MCSYWRARLVPFFTPRGGMVRSLLAPSANAYPKRTSRHLAEALGQVYDDRVAGALADLLAQLRLHRELVRPVAECHEGALERVAVDAPTHLDETAGAEELGRAVHLRVGPAARIRALLQRGREVVVEWCPGRHGLSFLVRGLRPAPRRGLIAQTGENGGSSPLCASTRFESSRMNMASTARSWPTNESFTNCPRSGAIRSR